MLKTQLLLHFPALQSELSAVKAELQRIGTSYADGMYFIDEIFNFHQLSHLNPALYATKSMLAFKISVINIHAVEDGGLTAISSFALNEKLHNSLQKQLLIFGVTIDAIKIAVVRDIMSEDDSTYDYKVFIISSQPYPLRIISAFIKSGFGFRSLGNMFSLSENMHLEDITLYSFVLVWKNVICSLNMHKNICTNACKMHRNIKIGYNGRRCSFT